MKKTFFTLLFLAVFIHSSNAAILTVSNDPKAPAEYASINAAITDANPGDTIMVYGSGTSYGTVSTTRKIILIGAGYRNPFGKNSIIATLHLSGDGAFDASHSYVTGFDINRLQFNGTSGTAKMIEGVVAERCRIHVVDFENSNVTYRNDTVRNCMLTNNYVYFSSGKLQGVMFHNNIMDDFNFYSGNASYSLAGVTARNNVIINRATENVFYLSRDLVLENNIFYAAEPQGCTDCAFNKNVTFANTNNVLTGVSSGNPGSVGTNYEDVNPLFEEYPIGGGGFNYSHDLTVKEPSLQTAGTDGTVVGIQGGLLFFEPGTNPAIPQMTEVSFPQNASSVKEGGTLNVTFKAKKQD
jgi:hypothetical protein